MECARRKPLKFVSLLLVRVFNLIFIFYYSKFDYNVWLVGGVEDVVGSFTHIHMSVFPGILFSCTL